MMSKVTVVAQRIGVEWKGMRTAHGAGTTYRLRNYRSVGVVLEEYVGVVPTRQRLHCRS